MTMPDMTRWQFSHGGAGVLLGDNVPDGLVDSPRARDGRRSIPIQRTYLHRPDGEQSVWETAPDSSARWRWRGLSAVRLASICSQARSTVHGDDPRHPSVGSTSELSGGSVPAFRLQALIWHPEVRIQR